MDTLKKLRRRAAKLSYLVEIAEQEHRLAALSKTGKPPMMGFLQQKEQTAHGWKTLEGHTGG